MSATNGPYPQESARPTSPNVVSLPKKKRIRSKSFKSVNHVLREMARVYAKLQLNARDRIEVADASKVIAMLDCIRRCVSERELEAWVKQLEEKYRKA